MGMVNLSMKYVGYKDRTFVPKRNQKEWFHNKDEKGTKKMPCVLNKVGNAEGASCRVDYLKSRTFGGRSMGELKRNHYWYALIVEYPEEDHSLFAHHLEVRTESAISNTSGSDGCDSGACNGGFCD